MAPPSGQADTASEFHQRVMLTMHHTKKTILLSVMFLYEKLVSFVSICYAVAVEQALCCAQALSAPAV